MQDLIPDFVEMQPVHQAAVVELISGAMNPNEAEWAGQTFDLHFRCQQTGIESARQFYVALLDSVIIGVVGLHQYRWGPDENVWLSWFAVRPDYQGKGIGKWLLSKIRATAQGKGYRKLFVETYQAKTFRRAIEFYRRQGFEQVGGISQYLPDNSDMLVFMLSIDESMDM